MKRDEYTIPEWVEQRRHDPKQRGLHCRTVTMGDTSPLALPGYVKARPARTIDRPGLPPVTIPALYHVMPRRAGGPR